MTTEEYSFRRSKKVTSGLGPFTTTFHKDLFDILISADSVEVNIKMHIITGLIEIKSFKESLINQLSGRITQTNSIKLINFLEKIFGKEGYIPINSIVRYSFGKDKINSSIYAYNSFTKEYRMDDIPFNLKKVLFDIYSTFPSNKSGSNRLEKNKKTGKSISNIRSIIFE